MQNPSSPNQQFTDLENINAGTTKLVVKIEM